ncbi:MAG: hypothetical protein JNM76_02815 [Betaproteobacteria bacterium]|nr:hypothetical protein [Betaproteobacteria bacterium]
MKSMLKWLVVAPLMSVLAACSSGLDQKIDASSDAAFASSLANIRNSAKPEEVAALEAALRALAVTDVSIGYEGGIVGALEKLQAQPVAQLRDRFEAAANGKAGRAIIAAAAKRKKEQAGRELPLVEQELAKLAKLGAEREAGKDILDKIEIQLPRFGYQPTPTGKLAMLEFKVANNTDQKLTSLFLRGSAIDPGSQKVLFVDDINYKLPTGLAPGETKDIRLPYSQPGKWNAPDIAQRSEVELGIEVVNAETRPGAKLVAHFTHKDAERLAQLEVQKPLLEAMAQGR